MAFAIDTKTYSKLLHFENGIQRGQPVGKGYSIRSVTPKRWRLIIHTTNGPSRPSSFHGEASFIRDSPAIGAEYCVGKGGQIAEILNPDAYYAWQSGTTLPGFWNPTSMGIEIQNSAVYDRQGRLLWQEEITEQQMAALTWLVRDHLIPRFHILREDIETHRAVALPKGRKPDPSGMSDVQFYTWRKAIYLAAPPTAPVGTYAVSPLFVAAWNASGGLWQPDQRLTPGYAITPEWLHNGLAYQTFERGVARCNADKTVSWLLLNELDDLPWQAGLR